MRITQHQLRQIIKEEIGTLRESEGPSWSDAKSEAAEILKRALKAKYAKSLKRGQRASRGFNLSDIDAVISDHLEEIVHELDDMSKHPDED